MNVQMAGIRNKEDALMCVKCGVNIIGLLVGQAHTSDDFISKEMAKEIKNALPKEIKTTLITHLDNAKEIIELVKFIDVDYIQLHSHLKESEVKKIRKAFPNKKLLRLIHIDENGKILNDVSKIKYVDFYFTDSINLKTNQVGGTGLIHNMETDKKLIETAVKVSCFVKGTKRETYSIIDECYCTNYEVDTVSRIDEFSRLVHSADRQITFKKSVDMPSHVKKVYCVWPGDIKSSMDGSGNKASGKADVTLGIVYADEKNNLSYCEKSVELDFEETLTENYEKLFCFHNLSVRDIKFSCEQKESVSLTLQTGFTAQIYSTTEKKHLAKIEILNDSPKKTTDAAVVIYFALKNERVWDIARSYNTTTDAIMQENEIDQEILTEDMMLMIPCG